VLQEKVLKSPGAPLHVRATNKQCNKLFRVGRLTFLLRQIDFFWSHKQRGSNSALLLFFWMQARLPVDLYPLF
jgi:hypothetical protein